MSFHRISTASGFLAILLITAQCTVQKRLYTKGWHIERNHRHHPEETAQEKRSIVEREGETQASTAFVPIPDTVEQHTISTEQQLQPETHVPAQNVKNRGIHVQPAPADTVYYAVPEKELPLAPAAKNAKITGLISAAAFIAIGFGLALLIVFSAGVTDVVIVIAAILLTIALALIPVTLIFGLIASIQRKDNPGMYSGKLGIGWFFLDILLMLGTGLLGLIYAFSV